MLVHPSCLMMLRLHRPDGLAQSCRRQHYLTAATASLLVAAHPSWDADLLAGSPPAMLSGSLTSLRTHPVRLVVCAHVKDHDEGAAASQALQQHAPVSTLGSVIYLQLV